MHKKIILVDMDNVIANFHKGVSERMKDDFPHLLPFLDDYESAYYARKMNADEHVLIGQYVSYLMNQPSFFADLEPLPDAVENIKMLMKDELYKVIFCSSPHEASVYCKQEKAEWLNRYFGEEASMDLILTHDKTLVIGDYLIDDKPFINGINKKPHWKLIVKENKHNAGLEMECKLSDWNQLYKLLE